VILDNYFNNEWKKDISGIDVPFHYVWEDKANSGFSMFGNVFDRYGVKKMTLKTAPTKENLKKANIYIIVDPDTEKETAKPNFVQQKDIEVIADWVKNGGILLLMANDSGNAEFTHFNQLAGKFGIHFDEVSKNRVQGNSYEQGAITIPPTNYIFPDAKKIYIKELSTVSLKRNPYAPSNINLKNGDDNILADVTYGKGRVIAVGDPWLYNEYVDGRKLPIEYENYNAAEDLVKWLIKVSTKK
jgi:unsaturated rhamnogalacturonyl hydrolase